MNKRTRYIQARLHEFRSDEARRQGIELYRIFHNATIEEIARSLPTTNLELLNIKGIGPTKAKKYGATILRIVEESEEVEETVEDAPVSASDEKVYSVGEFLDILNRAFAKKRVSVKGEITQANKRGPNWYVTIKDQEDDAALDCFIRSFVVPTGVALEQGQEIVVSGVGAIWKPSGRFSLQAHEVLLSGEGLLLKAFEELKKKLEKEGYFREERKRAIPSFVRKVGLITAKGSQAYQDFVKNLGQHSFSVEHMDVRVQGANAVSQIVDAFAYFNTSTDVEVIVLIRGGGSLEDLQAFNSEYVARAVYGSKAPVICGVGHEGDVSIADMVADVRVSTPTASAVYLSEIWNRVLQEMNTLHSAMYQRVLGVVRERVHTLERSADMLGERYGRALARTLTRLREVYSHLYRNVSLSFTTFARIEEKMHTNGQRIMHLLRDATSHAQRSGDNIARECRNLIERKAQYVHDVEKMLSLANPTLKLKQGYSIAFTADGSVVKSTKDVKQGDTMRVQVSDGNIRTKVDK